MGRPPLPKDRSRRRRYRQKVSDAAQMQQLVATLFATLFRYLAANPFPHLPFTPHYVWTFVALTCAPSVTGGRHD
ncbi:hypothetical protein M011DRAFT_471097 [Sporormia fimetaria CBS 119925]|uniref:Uncharacterized protein n=1 Tax=Sporormia fimetaria CBS 119925 TaxID=1340428 RepID=A0A6A6UZP6_9PLEO|nr:hypothetical protein M011DRAFT_471097 [Sporormia fimetaria CBS 119925]